MPYDAIQEWIKDLEKEFRDLYGPGGTYGDGGVTIAPDGRHGATPKYEAVAEAEEDYANLRNYVPDDREMYKPHYEGQNVRGPFASRPGIVTNQLSEDNVKEPDDDDYLNQLMMAALMAGGKKGKMGQLGGAAGGGISFGDKWTMNAPWEKDYRYLNA
jgi:hypothetical protein